MIGKHINYKHITTSTTTNIGGNNTELVSVVVGTGQTGATVTINDQTSGAAVAVISAAAAGSYSFYGVRIPGGLQVVTAGATPADVTICYV